MNEIVSFGEWTQKRRKVLDLTRNQLAKRVGCAAVTIKKIERDERRPSAEMAHLLAQHLQIPEEEQAAFVQMARGQYVPNLAHPTQLSAADMNGTAPEQVVYSQSTLPPQSTSFVGREAELIALEHLLAEPTTRLITLIGPGGIGKTRTALATATRTSGLFSDGVFFIPLAAINPTDTGDTLEAMIETIADALALPLHSNDTAENQLFAHLHPKKALIIIDNFEHLLAQATWISRLLQQAPHIKVLATSRERLNLQEEWLFSLTGLSYPTPDVALAEGANTLTDFSAITLFDQRFRQQNWEFDLATHIETVIHICQLVEGMPLALELAASWGATLSPGEIAAEIQQSLDFLATSFANVPHRHQSIRAVFEASWRYMGEQEQIIFPQLTVFQGGFTRQAVQVALGISLSSLNHLCHQSLLQANGAGDRYHIHELLRQYGAEHLAIAGQTDTIRHRHSDYYLAWLAEQETGLMGEGQLATLNEIEADFDNVRAAWQWAVSHHKAPPIDNALQAFFLFCAMRSRHQVGIDLLTQALNHFRDKPEYAYLYGRILCRRWSDLTGEGVRTWTDETFAEIEQFLAMTRHEEDEAEWAFGRGLMAAKAHDDGDYGTALSISEERLKIFQRLGDRYHQADVWDSIAYWSSGLGQVEKFREAAQQCLTLNRAIGNQVGVASGLILQGAYWFFYAGDLTQAREIFANAVAIDAEMGNHNQRTFSDGIIGWAYFLQGDFKQAGNIAQTTLAVAQNFNAPMGKAVALSLLGQLDALEGRYEAGLQRTVAAQGLSNNVVATGLVAYSLVSNSAGLGDYETIKPALIELLSHAVSIQAPTTLCFWLSLTALTLARHHQRLKRAVALLALVEAHPASDDLDFLGRWPLMAELTDDLESTLPAADYAAAQAQGQALDLLETGATVLNELTED